MCIKNALEALKQTIITEVGLNPYIEISFYDTTNDVLTSNLLAHHKADQIAELLDTEAVYHHRNNTHWFKIGNQIYLFFQPAPEPPSKRIIRRRPSVAEDPFFEYDCPF